MTNFVHVRAINWPLVSASVLRINKEFIRLMVVHGLCCALANYALIARRS